MISEPARAARIEARIAPDGAGPRPVMSRWIPQRTRWRVTTRWPPPAFPWRTPEPIIIASVARMEPPCGGIRGDGTENPDSTAFHPGYSG
jgi:hypothetical protein